MSQASGGTGWVCTGYRVKWNLNKGYIFGEWIWDNLAGFMCGVLRSYYQHLKLLFLDISKDSQVPPPHGSHMCYWPVLSTYMYT